MNYVKEHYKVILFWAILGIFLAQAATVLVHWVTLFSYNLDIKSLVHLDVCLNSNEQTLVTRRNVRPDGLKVKITEIVWKKEGDIWVKTDIKRSVKDIVYEKRDDAFSIKIKWESPFTELGEYRATTRYEIKPRGKYKTLTVPFNKQHPFNVIKCHGR